MGGNAGATGANNENDDVSTFEEVDLEAFSKDDPPLAAVGPPVEKTRATIAFCLLGLLAATSGFLLVMLWVERLDAQSFGTVAAIVLGPLFGLLGTATGYYYGKTG